MTLSLTSLHWEEYAFIQEVAMTQPIDIKLPNGLIIAMMPHATGRTLMKPGAVNETEAELWTRFVHALSTTDWKALASVYSTAMPMPSRPALVASKPAPAPVATPKEAPTK